MINNWSLVTLVTSDQLRVTKLHAEKNISAEEKKTSQDSWFSFADENQTRKERAQAQEK